MTGTEVTIATTVTEALAAMADGAKPVAGGTDLVVGARQGKTPLPPTLVAIDRLDELARIDAETDRGEVRIGSMVTHAELMTDQTMIDHYTAVADGAALVGSPATRNVGTLGGNVMNGSPAMDTGAPLVVLGAEVELRSQANPTRRLPIDRLWTGPGSTSALVDELCTAVILPPRPDRSGSAYVRLEYRRAMEIAVVGAAASVTVNDDATLAAVTVAMTAVAPTIVAVEQIDHLVGRPIDDELLRRVAAAASEQATPISDLRAGERYRRHTVGVMAGRATAAAAARAGGQSIAVPVNRAMGIGEAR